MNKNLSDMDTYVYIDVSNIRTSCYKTLGLKINFRKLLKYLKGKYRNLEAIRYYEGIAIGDDTKERKFKTLERAGYEICSLSRKSYIDKAVYREFCCKKCGFEQKIKVLSRSVKLKSNVDVYLATDLLEIAYLADKPTHIILMSCDGDYAEMIKNAISKNDNVHITVLATPPVRELERNTLSVRLRQLRRQIPRYQLVNIDTISDYVGEKIKE